MPTPVLLWLRRDLRLSDHPALTAAAKAGPVIPVFIHDDTVAGLGAAPKWRLGLGLSHFDEVLREQGSRLILRRGDALEVLRKLADETGARSVYWTRLYDPDAVARDTRVKEALKADGLEARSFGGHLMFEPWTVETQQGGYYKVYTPFWRAVKEREVDSPLSRPKLAAPDRWPESDTLSAWQMGAAMNRGADVVRPFVRLGEQAAQSRLGAFMAHIVRLLVEPISSLAYYLLMAMPYWFQIFILAGGIAHHIYRTSYLGNYSDWRLVPPRPSRTSYS